MIFVIDGPAGSGKSTTARAVADKLNIQYLDSGALYRAVTWIYIESGLNEKAFFEMLNQTPIDFVYDNGIFHVTIGGSEVTENLRTREVMNRVSEVASKPEVRRYVNRLLREFARNENVIAEGRDLGTVVFPDADLKFFMLASADERARRRYSELKSKGRDITFEEVRENILERDRKDSQREHDPLKKAENAIEIDTTDMTFEQQVKQICSLIEECKNKKESLN